jgi:hypothetical protein
MPPINLDLAPERPSRTVFQVAVAGPVLPSFSCILFKEDWKNVLGAAA